MKARSTRPRLRAGTPADLDAIERIETAVFDGDQLSRRSLRYFLSALTTDTIVAMEGRALAGYAMIGFRRRSTTGRLFSLAVGHDHVRRGIGFALLEAAEDIAGHRGCDRVRLEVRVDNPGAIALYERAGYRAFATVEEYYEDGTAALRYQKSLPGRRDAGAGPRLVLTAQ